MRRSTPAETDSEHEGRRPKLGPLQIWTLCAIPWLALVAGLSIYDHYRAIGRLAEARLSEGLVAFIVQWLMAAMQYSGSAFVFYGLLPLGIGFFLFVVFLPWAIPWAQGGDYED